MARLGQRAWRARTMARAMEIAPLAWRLRAEGRSLAEIATELNWRNLPTPQGRRWRQNGVQRMLRRTESEFPALATTAAAKPGRRVTRAQERAEAIVSLVWRIALTAKSLQAVAQELNRLGVPTTRGRKWGREGVRNALVRGRAALKRRVQAAAAEMARPRPTNETSWAFHAAPLVWRLKLDGLSRRKIAAELQRRDLPTPRGGRWRHNSVKNVLELTKGAFSPADDRIAA